MQYISHREKLLASFHGVHRWKFDVKFPTAQYGLQVNCLGWAVSHLEMLIGVFVSGCAIDSPLRQASTGCEKRKAITRFLLYILWNNLKSQRVNEDF